MDYIKPQETGNRTDVRWVSLTNDDGVGLLAKAEGNTMEFNALRYTPEQLSNTLHSYMLPEGQDITLRLNQVQMGLGGDNSWGAMPLTKYQIPANQTYEYTYTLKPINTNDPDEMMADYRTALPGAKQAVSFDDVALNHWASDSIRYVVEKGFFLRYHLCSHCYLHPCHAVDRAGPYERCGYRRQRSLVCRRDGVGQGERGVRRYQPRWRDYPRAAGRHALP